VAGHAEPYEAEGIYGVTFALCVAAAGLADVPKRERVARRVVTYLAGSGKGFFAANANAWRLKLDTDLDAVRRRDDFKKLISDVQTAARGPD
jgi:hypothetical protein